jgi:DNA-binding NarL/FixJ family response regulator
VARSPIRVAVRAAYPAVRAGLASLLRDEGYDVVIESNEREHVDLTRPDVLVIDVSGEGTGPEPDAPAVYLAEPGAVFDREDTAPHAWLPRDAMPAELDAAVRAVAAGMIVLHPSFAAITRDAAASAEVDTPVTAREREVLRLLADGLTNKAIARTLGISEHTAKFHVGALIAKLGAHSRTEAVTAAARRGLLSL